MSINTTVITENTNDIRITENASDTKQRIIQLNVYGKYCPKPLIVDITSRDGQVTFPKSYDLGTLNGTLRYSGNTYYCYNTKSNFYVNPTVTAGWVDSVSDVAKSIKYELTVPTTTMKYTPSTTTQSNTAGSYLYRQITVDPIPRDRTQYYTTGSGESTRYSKYQNGAIITQSSGLYTLIVTATTISNGAFFESTFSSIASLSNPIPNDKPMSLYCGAATIQLCSANGKTSSPKVTADDFYAGGSSFRIQHSVSGSSYIHRLYKGNTLIGSFTDSYNWCWVRILSVTAGDEPLGGSPVIIQQYSD